MVRYEVKDSSEEVVKLSLEPILDTVYLKAERGGRSTFLCGITNGRLEIQSSTASLNGAFTIDGQYQEVEVVDSRNRRLVPEQKVSERAPKAQRTPCDNPFEIPCDEIEGDALTVRYPIGMGVAIVTCRELGDAASTRLNRETGTQLRDSLSRWLDS